MLGRIACVVHRSCVNIQPGAAVLMSDGLLTRFTGPSSYNTRLVVQEETTAPCSGERKPLHGSAVLRWERTARPPSQNCCHLLPLDASQRAATGRPRFTLVAAVSHLSESAARQQGEGKDAQQRLHHAAGGSGQRGSNCYYCRQQHDSTRGIAKAVWMYLEIDTRALPTRLGTFWRGSRCVATATGHNRHHGRPARRNVFLLSLFGGKVLLDGIFCAFSRFQDSMKSA